MNKTPAKLMDFESIANRYAHGECGPFAVACVRAHQVEGWRLVMFTSGGYFKHAAAKTRDGFYFDAYGFCNLETLQKRYHCDLEEESATEQDLMDITEIDEGKIDEANEHRAMLEDMLIQVGIARVKDGAFAPVNKPQVRMGPGSRSHRR